MKVVHEEGSRPIKAWVGEVSDIEASALVQLKNLSRLPFIHNNGVAVMPDVHAGKGSTVGSVIATEKAVIPAAVGVDIGCGMNAIRLSNWRYWNERMHKEGLICMQKFYIEQVARHKPKSLEDFDNLDQAATRHEQGWDKPRKVDDGRPQ